MDCLRVVLASKWELEIHAEGGADSPALEYSYPACGFDIIVFDT